MSGLLKPSPIYCPCPTTTLTNKNSQCVMCTYLWCVVWEDREKGDDPGLVCFNTHVRKLKLLRNFCLNDEQDDNCSRIFGGPN